MHIDDYNLLIGVVRRLHVTYLNRVKRELIGISDITPEQALVIYNLGNRRVTINEIAYAGSYHNSSVTYNTRKLVEYGYLNRTPAPRDRRSYMVELTEKGHALRDRLVAMHERQAATLDHADGVLAWLDSLEHRLAIDATSDATPGIQALAPLLLLDRLDRAHG